MAANRRVDTNIEAWPESYTIPSFCLRHNISESLYYEIRRIGRGPREAWIGSRRVITAEAAAEWRRDVTESPISSTDIDAGGGQPKVKESAAEISKFETQGSNR